MMPSHTELHEQLDELSSAEDFLEFFNIEHQRHIVQVNRLHILQRFHDLLSVAPAEEREDQYGHYRALLMAAYNDFVDSSAQQQKVLKVFQSPKSAFVSVSEL